jgi:tRNA(fMet)-specific endonuclease VapC
MRESYNSMTHGRKAAMRDRVLIDTSVWIEFFRRKDSPISSRLRHYLELNQVCFVGPVVIELFQGARTSREIDVINQLLETIHYIEITRTHYHHAGQMSYEASRKGQIFSVVDLILAVVAHDEQLRLFTLDTHFKDISRFCPLLLDS